MDDVTASDGEAGDQFGWSVAINTLNYELIGSPIDDDIKK